MQEDDNLHTRLNPQQEYSSVPNHPHYPGTQYPPLQQQQQYSYPPYNPQVAYPHPYGDQTRQGQYVGPVQFQGSSAQEALRDATMRINTQFGCYMCLVYFELVVSILSLIMSIISATHIHAYETLLVLDIILTLPLLAGCIVAIQAKSNLNKSKQYAAFVLFIISTAVSFALSVMAGVWTGWDPLSVVALGIRSFIGLFLIFGAYSLYQLMCTRDNVMGNNAFEPIIRA